MILKLFILLAVISSGVLARYFDDADQCGIMSKASGLIQGGFNSTQLQFPWIAIISVRNNSKWDQNGSGSLISRRHVVVKSRYVATQDINGTYVAIDPKNLEIYLGTTRYGDLSQMGSLKVGVTGITLYPNSRKENGQLSLHNSAILTLDRDVPFSDFVKPVCLWTNKINSNGIDSDAQQLIAVGYGRDLSGQISKTRKHVALRMTSQDDCKEEFDHEVSVDGKFSYFCVKEIVRDHGPCHFDSQLYVKINSAWYLRGLMVSAVVNQESKFCEVSYPTIVEDTSFYANWINKQVKSELAVNEIETQEVFEVDIINYQNRTLLEIIMPVSE